MPLTDVLNTGESESASGTKRAHGESESVDSPPTVSKRPRYAFSESPEPDEVAGPDPYSTLPPPSPIYVQLRVQLCRFKGVYRIVRLPLTFTFANLYQFMLLVFGWSGDHLHELSVCTNVVMYSAQWRPGEIKSFGQRIPPEPERTAENLEEWGDWLLECDRKRYAPVMRVEPFGRGRARPSYGFDDFEATEVKQDHEVTLGEVWNMDKRKNASKGECGNRKIAIKMEYDLGSSWYVHISIHCSKDGGYMFRRDPPTNYPIVLTAKGAPPIEDACEEIYGEWDPKKKKVSDLIYDSTTFAKYTAGEVGSCARKTELAIFNCEEESARQRALAEEREERRKQRKKEREERRQQDEESDEYAWVYEEVSEDDDEYE